jgi:hypothetical protein
MAEWREIYDFWFGAPGSEGHGDVREILVRQYAGYRP